MGYRSVSLVLTAILMLLSSAVAEVSASPAPSLSALYSQTGDNDGDGIPDEMDPDDDNDGIFDASDPDPYDPAVPAEDVDPEPDTIISPDVDSDSDTIPNEMDPDDNNDSVNDADTPADADPLAPGPGAGGSVPGIVDPTADSDGDGIPNEMDPDDDNDGIVDAHDFAPFDPNVTVAPAVEPTSTPSSDVSETGETPPTSNQSSTVPVVTSLPSTGVNPNYPVPGAAGAVAAFLIGLVLFTTQRWQKRHEA